MHAVLPRHQGLLIFSSLSGSPKTHGPSCATATSRFSTSAVTSPSDARRSSSKPQWRRPKQRRRNAADNRSTGSASISRSGSFTLQSQAVCGPSAEQSDGLRRRCPMHCVDSSTKGWWSLLTTNRCCRNSSTERFRRGDIARDPLQWSVIQQPRQTRRHFEHGSPTLPVLDGRGPVPRPSEHGRCRASDEVLDGPN